MIAQCCEPMSNLASWAATSAPEIRNRSGKNPWELLKNGIVAACSVYHAFSYDPGAISEIGPVIGTSADGP